MIKLLITLLLVVSIQSSLYLKHLHDISTGARCLDGSPAALYVSEGLNSHILLFFNGGGFCEGDSVSSMLESCLTRTNTDLGSSENYPDIKDFSNYGILSNDQDKNPNFWNWTKAYIPYCDGSLHQGSRLQPVNYQGKDLYFRGSNNSLQHFQYMNQTHQLFQAEKIVITGISAGGVASYIWGNYLYENSVSKNVYSMPDSGLFLSTYINPYTKRPTLIDFGLPLFQMVNNETKMPISECVDAVGDSLACFQFSILPQFFKVPLFIIESEYDQFSLANILTMKCLQSGSYGAFSLQKCTDIEKSYVESYRNATLEAFNNFTKALTRIGFWAPACVQHGFSETNAAFTGDNYRVPEQTGSTLSDAMAKFMADVSAKTANTHIDSVQWPNNKGCSALKENGNLKKRIVYDE